MLRNTWLRKSTILAGIATALISTLLGSAAAPAQPLQEPHPQAARTSQDVPVTGGISGKEARALAGKLGPSRTGGIYLDRKSGRLVIAVTDDAAERDVRDAGGITKRVDHSTADLDAITNTLNESVTTPGTKWGTNGAANRIYVEADSTVSDADFAKLAEIVAPFGSAVHISRTGGRLRTTHSGGNFISAYNVDCSTAFNEVFSAM
ncbi:alpha-lytic protease prodomain-containing protein [Streptomyces chartreusis]